MDVQETINNQTDVTLSLTKHPLLIEGKGLNLVLSPLSIHVVERSTLDQLLSFLKSMSNNQLNSFASKLVAVVFVDGSSSGGP
ncbi:hypothetical protein UlMin_041432 [Ulmus minor]